MLLTLASSGAAFSKSLGLILTFFVILPAIATALIIVAIALARGERQDNEQYRAERAERLAAD